MVPTGTPRPIIDKLHAALIKVLADPRVQERMRRAARSPSAANHLEDFKSYIDGETAKWTKVIEDSGVRAD